MLDDIRQSFDTLTSNINAFLDWAKDIETREKLLDEKDIVLRNRHEQQDKREADLTTRDGKIASDKLILDQKANELADDRLKIESIDRKLEELEKKDGEIKAKQKNLDERQVKIAEQEKEMEKLETVREELEHRDILLKKESLIDKVRKEKLDKREKYINDEKIRLQQIASRLGENLKSEE